MCPQIEVYMQPYFVRKRKKKNRDVIVLYIDDDIQSPIRIRVVLFWITGALSKRDHYISKKIFCTDDHFLKKMKNKYQILSSRSTNGFILFCVGGKIYPSKNNLDFLLQPIWE